MIAASILLERSYASDAAAKTTARGPKGTKNKHVKTAFRKRFGFNIFPIGTFRFFDAFSVAVWPAKNEAPQDGHSMASPGVTSPSRTWLHCGHTTFTLIPFQTIRFYLALFGLVPKTCFGKCGFAVLFYRNEFACISSRRPEVSINLSNCFHDFLRPRFVIRGYQTMAPLETQSLPNKEPSSFRTSKRKSTFPTERRVLAGMVSVTLFFAMGCALLFL